MVTAQEEGCTSQEPKGRNLPAATRSPSMNKMVRAMGEGRGGAMGRVFCLGHHFLFFVIYHFLEFWNSQKNSPESPIFEICKFCKNLEIGNILVLIKVN